MVKIKISSTGMEATPAPRPFPSPFHLETPIDDNGKRENGNVDSARDHRCAPPYSLPHNLVTSPAPSILSHEAGAAHDATRLAHGGINVNMQVYNRK